MNVTCQIIPYQPIDGVYYTGHPVRGKVKYEIQNAKKYEAIVLSLIGTGKCKWVESDSDSGSTANNEEYVASHVNILPHPAVLQPGSYEHEYQFQLPENVPSSFKNSNCTIKYQIQIKFEKINSFNFTISKKFKLEIPVYEVFEASEGPVIFGVDKTLLKLLSAKKNYVKVTGEVGKTCFLPGENIKLSILVKNDTNDRPTVKASLRCYTTLTGRHGAQRKGTDKIKNCFAVTPEINARTEMKFILSIPTRSELYTINCKVMKKEYKLRIKVVLPAPHWNAVVEMPITIGEQRGNGGGEVEGLKEMAWETMMEDSE